MAGWLTYLIRRSPPATLSVVAGGIALSGLWLGGGGFDASSFALAFVGLLLFMVLARLVDELKDYEKDKVAHPDRPLPRGIITPAAARRVSCLLFGGVATYSVLLVIIAGWRAGALYAVSGLWLWLMSAEFFAGEALVARPLLSALLHQVVLLPLYAFATAVRQPELALAPLGLAYAVTNFGASMAYEVGRKLDPDAHPVLGYYGTRYGLPRCAVTIALCLAVAAAGAWRLGDETVLWPVELAVLAAVGLVLVRPGMHPAVEAAAAFCVVVHVWAVPLRRAAEWLP